MAVQRNTKSFTLEDLLIVNGGANMNGNFVLPHSTMPVQNFPPGHPYASPMQQQQQIQQQYAYPLSSRVPNPPNTNWYGGSQPSLDSQAYFSNFGLSSGPNPIAAVHRSVEMFNPRVPLNTTSSQGPNCTRLANHRARLRRSNTVGSSEIGQHLPMAMVQTTAVSGSSHPGMHFDPMTYFLRQNFNSYASDGGPPLGNALAGHSPTERVLRRLAQMNATSSLDRNGSMATGTTSTSQRFPFDCSQTGKSNPPDVEPNSAVKGSLQSGSFTSPISRRSRLRREYTMDTGSSNLSQTREFTSHPQLATKPSENSFSQPPPLAVAQSQESGMPSTVGQPEGVDLIPVELCFSAERFQGRVLVQWLCRQLVLAGDVWSCNLITLVTNICSCLLRLGVLQPEQPGAGQTASRDRSRVRPPLLHSSSLDDGSGGSTSRNTSTPVGQMTSTNANTKYDERGIKFELNGYYRWTGQHMSRVLELLHSSTSRTGTDPMGASFCSSQEMLPFHSRVQDEFAGLRKDYEYELERLTREHELQLFRVKNQGVMKVCQLTDRIEALEQEVEKYRILAGIEHLTRSSLLDDSANAHRSETGLELTPSSAQSGSDRRYVKRFPTSSPIRGDRPRPMRVGFSFPEAVDADNNPHKPPQRPRARSEVANMASNLKSIESPPPIANEQGRKEDLIPTSTDPQLADFVTDELPRTKGFLRRLKQMGAASNLAAGGSGSSTGTDSGMGNSRSSRTDSRDTSYRSEFSLETEDVERSQYIQTKAVDRAPPVPQRNPDLFLKSNERFDRLPANSAMSFINSNNSTTERPDPYHSADLNQSACSSQSTDVLGRALNAISRSNYPTGFNDDIAGTPTNRFRSDSGLSKHPSGTRNNNYY